MIYRLIFAPSFEADIDAQITYLRTSKQVANHVIEDWFGKVYKRMRGVESWPRLYPVDEVYSAQSGRESRKINFGDYVLIYQVNDEKRCVEFVAFHHGATHDIS